MQTRQSGLIGRVLIAGVAVLATACASLSGAARTAFAQHFACPPERVTVAERSDIHPTINVPDKPPPPEVAADPERLAYYRKMNQPAHTIPNPVYDGYDFFDATGCGHHAIYACLHPTMPDGIANDSARADCAEYGME